MTPLMVAIMFNKNPEALTMLLKAPHDHLGVLVVL
jgi:hypothetical protein